MKVEQNTPSIHTHIQIIKEDLRRAIALFFNSKLALIWIYTGWI